MQVVDLLRGFDRERFSIHLFTFDTDQPLSDKLKGIQLNHVNHPRRHKYDFSMIPALSKMIDENQIDLLHTSLQIALLFGWLGRFFSRRKPPLVNALHKMVGRNKKESLLEFFLYQWPMRACQRIICVCISQKNFWQSKFPYIKRKATVIYNGVDTDRFEKSKFIAAGLTMRTDYGIPPTAPVIACVAAFRVEKNHVGLLTSFSKVSIPHNPAYLVLAGDGAGRDSIKQLASELGIADRVIFLGNIGDVRPLLATASLSVLASVAIETFSIAMLESMSMCCPVLSTDIGGHREAIKPGITGDIVPVGDTDALTTSLSRLLSSQDTLQEMGAKARQLVLKMFSLNTMVKNTEELIQAVLKELQGK